MINNVEMAALKPATLYNPSGIVNVFTPAGATEVVNRNLLFPKLFEMLKAEFQMLAETIAPEHSFASTGMLNGSSKVTSNDDKSTLRFWLPVAGSESNTRHTLFLISDIEY